MPLVFWGNSECTICGQVLNEGDEIIGVPPIIQNRADPLYAFNDIAFHRACLIQHQHWEKIQLLLELFDNCWNKKKCLVCDQEVNDWNDYLATGLLALDKDDPLFRYNFLSFHKKHFADWDKRQFFLKELEQRKTDGRWIGEGIDLFFAL